MSAPASLIFEKWTGNSFMTCLGLSSFSSGDPMDAGTRRKGGSGEPQALPALPTIGKFYAREAFFGNPEPLKCYMRRNIPISCRQI